MAGTLLGPDQVKKLNSMFPTLVAHLRDLLAKDHTGFGLMRVHVQVETFDSDEMARIFRELNFVLPKEKLALVRAAIYHLMATEPALFVAPLPEVVLVPKTEQESQVVKEETLKLFTPAFKLNVNGVEAFHGERPADTPKPTPIVTSTHESIVAKNLEAGKQAEAAHTQELAEKAAEVRQTEDVKIAAAIAALKAASQSEEVAAADESLAGE